MPARTKILFLIHTLQVGGAERILVNLVNNMNRAKFDITVMTVVDTGAFRERLNDYIHYKTIISLPKIEKRRKSSSGNLLGGTSKIKNVLAEIYQVAWRHVNIGKVYRKRVADEYDVEVAFLEGISTKIIANSNNKNSKKIAWVHIDLQEERKSEKFYKSFEDEKATYEKFDQVVAVSEKVKESFMEKFDNDGKKVIVEYNPLDAKEIREKAAKVSISKKKFTICTVGRLSKQKGFDRLLRIAKKIRNEGIEFDLWIIGVGPEEAILQKYIKENNLKNVFLLGYKNNPYPYIKSADLYVCSSVTEGFSTTVSEAMILGTPVVTTDCPGMKEILGDSKYGIVCKNDEEELANVIKNVILDKKMYNSYVRKAKERGKLFDLQRSVEEISKIFR